MDTVTVNMGHLALLLSSVLVLMSAIFCIRKTIRLINRSK